MSGGSIVQTNALLVYLHDQAGGSASLRELARHFGLPWSTILDLLWSASLVEIDGIVDAYSLVLPPRPGQEEGDEEPTTADSLVSFHTFGREDVPELSLTLDEVIALVAVIDSICEVTPPGDPATALGNLRSKLAAACQAAGFEDVIWPGPAPVIAERAAAGIEAALTSPSWIELSYHRPGPGLREDVTHARVIPLQVRSAVNPLLIAWSEDGLRSYRLDRIGSVDILGKASRAEVRAAREAAGEADDWTIEGEDVTLTVSPSGRWIAETLPGAVSARRGTATEVTFVCRSDEFLSALLIQLGSAVIQIEPAAVRGRMAARFAGLMEAAQ